MQSKDSVIHCEIAAAGCILGSSITSGHSRKARGLYGWNRKTCCMLSSLDFLLISCCTKASTIAVLTARSTRVSVFESLLFPPISSTSTRTQNRYAAVPYSSFSLSCMKAKIRISPVQRVQLWVFPRILVTKKNTPRALSFVCSEEPNKK